MKQFNFSRNWRKKIVPLLNHPSVQKALHLGIGLGGIGYIPDDPPWLYGRGPLNGQRARKGCLSWYQPWGRCHLIAPFSWAIGKELFPDLKWGFISSDIHTVAIGFHDTWKQPECLMDILLFRKKTAQESLDFARSHGWKFYRSLHEYAASFCNDPESVLEILKQLMQDDNQ